MKKILLTAILCFIAVIVSSALFASGRNMNANMSAEWAKTLNRNASTDVDAAFFNPAGTALMADGFYMYLGDEVIYQPVKIKVRGGHMNQLAGLSRDEYHGQKTAWYFPVGHLVLKKDRLSISGCSNGLGGGGVATFRNGLQQLDAQVKLLGMLANPIFNGLGIPGNLIGSSVRSKVWASSAIYNVQLNIAYEVIKDKLSLAVGGRLLIGNTDVDININNIANLNGATTLGTLIPMGGDYHSYQLGFAGGAIIGICAKPVENLAIAVTGSWNSPLNLKTKAFQDLIIGMQDPGMKNKGRSAQQLPAEIKVGIAYKIGGLQLSPSFAYQFNQFAQWKGKEKGYTGGYDAGLGIDYTFEKVPINIGIGYLWAFSGCRPSSRDQLHEDLSAHSGSIGLTWNINENMKLTLGEVVTSYVPEDANAGGLLRLFPAKFYKMSYLTAIGLSSKI